MAITHLEQTHGISVFTESYFAIKKPNFQQQQITQEQISITAEIVLKLKQCNSGYNNIELYSFKQHERIWIFQTPRQQSETPDLSNAPKPNFL